LDRDLNSSIIILLEGLRIIGVELSDYTDEGLNKTSAKKRRPSEVRSPLVFSQWVVHKSLGMVTGTFNKSFAAGLSI
jgi:hypothetical protein